MEYGQTLTEATAEKLKSVDISVGKPSCAMCTILTGLEIDAAKNGEHPNLDIILGNDIEKCSYIVCFYF